MTNTTPLNSGDGTRPSTSGGVDNMGAGKKLGTTHNAAGEDVDGPPPAERMRLKRANVEGTKADDSAPFGLRPEVEPETNEEAPKQP